MDHEVAEHEEPYVRTLNEYLQGPEWMLNLRTCLRSRAHTFMALRPGEDAENGHGEEADFGHEQHAMFVEFRTWAEAMMGTVLSQMGISEAELLEMVERKLGQGAACGPALREHLSSLLDVACSLGSFRNFDRLMRAEFDRLCDEDAEETCILQGQLEQHEWELQVALAASLLDARLQEADAPLLPWAEAVVALNDALQHLNAPGQGAAAQADGAAHVERLQEELVLARLEVDFLVAERLFPKSHEDEGQSGKAELGLEPGAESVAESVLAQLLEASGQTQLAATQQRAAFDKRHPQLSADSYERLYFALREQVQTQSQSQSQGQTGFPRTRSELASLGAKLGADDAYFSGLLSTDLTVLEDMCRILTLEDSLRAINRDLQEELRSPGSVKLKPPGHGGVGAGAEAAEALAMKKSKSRRDLLVDTSAALEDVSSFLRKTPKHPLSPGSHVSTPKDARRAILEMQEKLRVVSQLREVDQLRSQLGQGSASPEQMQRDAHHLAQMEAMSMAEQGVAVHFALEGQAYDTMVGDFRPSAAQGELEMELQGRVGDVDDGASDGTVEEEEEEEVAAAQAEGEGAAESQGRRRVSLSIDASQPDDARSLLKETERIRREILLRSSPKAGARGGKLQLNSPQNAHTRSSPQLPSNAASPSSFAAQMVRQQVAAPRSDVIVNPASLRFLANNYN